VNDVCRQTHGIHWIKQINSSRIIKQEVVGSTNVSLPTISCHAAGMKLMPPESTKGSKEYQESAKNGQISLSKPAFVNFCLAKVQ
jgi:hypothetical protein